MVDRRAARHSQSPFCSLMMSLSNHEPPKSASFDNLRMSGIWCRINYSGKALRDRDRALPRRQDMVIMGYQGPVARQILEVGLIPVEQPTGV